MQTTRIQKEKLREIVQRNRDNHRGEFEKALGEYKKAVIHYLGEQIKRAEQGLIVDNYISIPQPEDHTVDYDQVLEMLDLSVDDTIELTYRDFSQYVRDDWGWKGQFATTNATLAAYNEHA